MLNKKIDAFWTPYFAYINKCMFYFSIFRRENKRGGPRAKKMKIEVSLIQSGAKKNTTFSKSIFSYLYISKYTILYIKLNTIGWTLWSWKLYQKIFYDKFFIRLWKRPLKNTTHKKRYFQWKRSNLFLLRVERKETRNQNNSV